MFILCISYRKQRHRFAMRSLNVEKNSVTDIKVDVKLFSRQENCRLWHGTEGNLRVSSQTAAALLVARGHGAGVP